MKTYEITLVVEVNAETATSAIRKVAGYPGQDVKTISISAIEVITEEEEDSK